MKIKQVPNKCFYCIEKELTIPEIAEFSEKTVQTLYEDADSKGLDIIGPLEYIYLNCTGEPETPFMLIVAIPVGEPRPTTGHFFCMQTPPFDCVAIDFKGSMPDIGKAWEDFIQQAVRAGYLFSNQGREIYKEWVSFESEDNIAELQLGIIGKKLE